MGVCGDLGIPLMEAGSCVRIILSRIRETARLWRRMDDFAVTWVGWSIKRTEATDSGIMPMGNTHESKESL